jgi:hypothetical protein
MARPEVSSRAPAALESETVSIATFITPTGESRSCRMAFSELAL